MTAQSVLCLLLVVWIGDHRMPFCAPRDMHTEICQMLILYGVQFFGIGDFYDMAFLTSVQTATRLRIFVHHILKAFLFLDVVVMSLQR